MSMPLALFSAITFVNLRSISPSASPWLRMKPHSAIGINVGELGMARQVSAHQLERHPSERVPIDARRMNACGTKLIIGTTLRAQLNAKRLAHDTV